MVNNLIATIINCSQKITWRKVLLVTFIAITLVFMFSFSASADDELAKCTPKKYYDEMKDCNICSLFAVVFNAASSIARRAMDVFSLPIRDVVIIIFAIWVAIQILQFAASFEVRDLKDLVSAIVIQSFIVILVVALLNSNAMSFLNTVLNPIYTSGQNLAQTVINPNSEGCPSNTGIIDDSTGKGALPKAMGDNIYCTIDLIQKRVSQIKALGSASMCKSWQERWIILPHLNYLFTGLGLWVGAVVMLLAVPLMLVDSVFQLAVAAALLPFAIGSYAFKITRAYTKKIWETFLNSVFCFIFVSLTCLMLVTAYQSIISGAVGDLSYMFEGEATDAKFIDILNKLSWFSTAFLEVVFVMILTWSVLQGGKELGGEFAGSISNTSIGSSIGTMGASAAKSFALKAGKKTGEAAWRHGSRAVKGVGAVGGNLANRAISNYQGRRAVRRGQQQGDGSYSYSNAFGKFKVTQNADGSYKVEKTRKMLFGLLGKKQTIRDGNIVTERVIKKQNGQEVVKKEKVKNHSLINRILFNENGTLNTNGGVSNFEDEMQKIALSASDEQAKEQKQLEFVKAAVAEAIPNAENSGYTSQVVTENKNGVFSYVQNNTDGGKTFVKVEVKEVDGKKFMLIEMTTIDAKGRGTTLKTNGVVHSKTTFKTKDGTVNGEIDEKSIKKEYALNKYYEHYRRHKRYNFISKVLGTASVGFEGELDEMHQGIHNVNGIREFGFYIE